MREPYLVHTSTAAVDQDSWEWLSRTILGGQADRYGFNSPVWSQHHNKVVALRDVLLEGGGYQEVMKRMEAWQVASHELALPPQWNTPVLRDALEVQDFYWNLDSERREESGGGR
jgi:hypothetical protein